MYCIDYDIDSVRSIGTWRGEDPSFSLTVLLNGRRGVLKWNNQLAKNLYCLLWFTCEIRTRDTQVSPLLRMSTSFSGEPNGWKGLECWIHHRKTPTARGYPTISLTKLHKSRFNHSSKESWLAKRYTRRIARRSVLVPLLWVGFRVSRKDARKGKERVINTQDTSCNGY